MQKKIWKTFDTNKFDVTKFANWDWVRAILDEGHDADGEFHDQESSPEQVEEWDGLKYQALLALPLTSIDSAQVLKDKLIDPLINRISEH